MPLSLICSSLNLHTAALIIISRFCLSCFLALVDLFPVLLTLFTLFFLSFSLLLLLSVSLCRATAAGGCTLRGLTLCPLRVTALGGAGSDGISLSPEPCSGTAGHGRPGEGALTRITPQHVIMPQLCNDSSHGHMSFLVQSHLQFKLHCRNAFLCVFVMFLVQISKNSQTKKHFQDKKKI